jgi:hypothetical protein
MTLRPIDPSDPDVDAAGAVVRVRDYCRHASTAERAERDETYRRIGESFGPLASVLYELDVIDGAQFNTACDFGHEIAAAAEGSLMWARERAFRHALALGRDVHVLGPDSLGDYWTASAEVHAGLWPGLEPRYTYRADGSEVSPVTP